MSRLANLWEETAVAAPQTSRSTGRRKPTSR